MEEIATSDGQIVAIVVRDKFKKEGINFISQSLYPLQVGINSYRKDDKIKPHVHLSRQIVIETTEEVVYIKTGKVKINLYDSDKKNLRSLTLSAGDLVFFVSGGHGLDMLEDTTIIEVKQGPYLGKNLDKVMVE